MDTLKQSKNRGGRPTQNVTLPAQFGKQQTIPGRHSTVINGRVKSEDSDSESLSDIEYQFHYSVSEIEKSDHYVYTFDTFPVSFEGETEKEHSHNVEFLQEHFSDQNSLSIKNAEDSIHVTGVGNINAIQTLSLRTPSVKKSGNGQSVLKRALPASARADKLGNSHVVMLEKQTPVPKDTNTTQTECDQPGIRKVSTISRPSTTVSIRNSLNLGGKRQSLCYDPVLEKSSAFIHGGGKNFSRASTSLLPIRHGLKHVQMNYTETNLENNQRIIFKDLLKSSKKTSDIRLSQIRSIERRLETRRNNPLYSTSFYEHKNIPDPYRRNEKKTARAAAQKKIERKKKIKQISDELQTGYVPTHVTMKLAEREEVVAIGKNCRYLRKMSTTSV